MYKIAKIIVLVLAVIGIALWLYITNSEDNGGAVDWMLRLGMWMTYLAAIVVLVFSVLALLGNPAKLKSTLLGVGAFLVVMAISYFVIAGGEGSEKTVSAGLNTFYILLFVAIGAMIYGGVKKIVSK